MLTMLDFYEPSEARNAPYKAQLEIRKLPKRLSLDETEDLVEFAADQKTFEDQIAIAGEALFARANKPKKARDQANSRIRTVLGQFLAARSGLPATADHPDYETVEAWVRENEGFVDRGDLFPQGRSAAIAMLCKWFGHIALRDITAADVQAALARIPSAKRRSFGSALTFVDRLNADASWLPSEVAACLPRESLRVADPDKPVHWPDLPTPLQISATAVFDALLMQTTAQADAALARIKAGEDPELVAMDVNAARSKDVTNPAIWREGQQGHVGWLYRGALRCGRRPECLEDLLTLDTFEAALDAHAAAAAAKAGRVRAALETSTLKSRFTGLI